METVDIEQVILYDIDQILKCVRGRSLRSAIPFARHLFLLLVVAAIKEEREYHGVPIIKHPDI